ncbi:hypothetical protein [Loktanella sp. M215]|uniref:hypothetical protein n=1 Tax=Loktanella sp. M215 TaxID=2675431 RepID=UPI001F38D0B8|nr:hypothetical protein [Loktanella sp. M215]MCF7697995.1 hypothetical protein [Loktanella sp. M215]
MGMTWITRLAAGARVPVFIAMGDGAPAAATTLSRHPGLSVVDTPRAASILLVAGQMPDALIPYLHRLHDQLPHPRATLLWQSPPLPSLPDAIAVAADDDIGQAVADIFAEVLAGKRASAPDILPDAPPSEWRGVGPHGQGGKGMMGGTPYGRPMAMTDNDIRDGLALDSYTAAFGPFLPFFPPGLVLTLTLQGDVIQKAVVTHPPFDHDGSPLATLLNLLGLPALATRSLGDRADDPVLRRLIRLSGARFAIPSGLGRLPDGSDVRTRFDRMTGAAPDAASQDAGDTTLEHLLVGLEWHSAMLVLCSLDPAILRDICKNSDTGDQDEKQDESGSEMHAGHMS